MDSAVVRPGRFHSSYCSADADVVIKASDGLLFRIHRLNLQANSGFAPPDVSTSVEDPACFDEPAEVLELLFKYLYHTESPFPESWPLELQISVGCAAHKYQMGFAIQSVENTLYNMYSGFVVEHVQCVGEVVVYAADYMEDELLDDLALNLLLPSYSTIKRYDNPTLCFAYLLYRNNWVDAFKNKRKAEYLWRDQDGDVQNIYLYMWSWLRQNPSDRRDVRFSECLREVRAMQNGTM
ncbi:hypothetical protein CYLTODRAFT_211076 [Cylindrobasidium torrendii FP15055 ss-10]|uniref:BTB domain-containing protein n=1 Tax=Cylindrobasidium torrendii FP15055 ss-10 TaxID=1314674 RepID=A0A0D7BIG0_9AGAR|nr:hypothetical protein CYLTODRAFT_211076 [Cylindrobasidium torrendii FP15055 ss-10]